MPRTVWITGASSGIGAALARRWAARGDRVILSARRAAELEVVRAGFADPSLGLVLPLDVEDEAAVEAAARQALAWSGGIDVLVHNAGYSQRSTALETSMETARRLMDVHYFALLSLSKAVVPSMVTRGSGQVVVMSSVAGHVSTPLRSTYAAAKHAQRAWADALRAELHGSGVDVTVVCPGYIATGISAHAVLGDGKAQGTLDELDLHGMDVEVAVDRMLRAIDARQAEVLVGGWEAWGALLKRWAPGLVRHFLPRVAPR